jgi:hypothetical protein
VFVVTVREEEEEEERRRRRRRRRFCNAKPFLESLERLRRG